MNNKTREQILKEQSEAAKQDQTYWELLEQLARAEHPIFTDDLDNDNRNR
jgi:hypothetical protein